jgi:hypothetical protein
MRTFELEMLKKMTNEQLILHISEIYKELKNTSPVKPSKAGVVTSGSPRYVRTYVDLIKKQLKEEKGESNG